MPKLSRRLLMGAALGGLTASLTACGQKTYERLEPAAAPSQVTTSQAVSGSDPRKWVLFGDSLTAASTITEELAGLTGYEIINAGISGDTSIDVALRAGALEARITLADQKIQAQGPSEVVSLEPSDFVAPNAWHYPARLSGVTGYLIRKSPTDPLYFEPSQPGAGLDLGGPVKLEIDPEGETDYLRKGLEQRYSMIIGLGRNDLTLKLELDQLIDNIKALLAQAQQTQSQQAQPRYLIWDLVPWTYEPYGSEGRASLDSWNQRLREEFGDRFASPVASFFADPEQTMRESGLTPSQQDFDDLGKGILPASLRKDDLGHFNAAGSRVWAHYMFQEIKKRGW